MIPYKEKELELEDQYKDFVFALAKDTHTLYDVGSFMDICVGGYDQRAVSKNCIIMVAYDPKDFHPKICLELYKNNDGKLQLQQAKGRFNNTNFAHGALKEDMYDAVMTFCLKNNIKTDDCFDLKLSHKVHYEGGVVYDECTR